MPLERRVSWLVRVFNRADRRSSSASIATRRRQAAAVSRKRAWSLVIPAGPVPAEQVDLEVPVRDGRIRVRIYRPHGPGPFPLYLFIHGGGGAPEPSRNAMVGAGPSRQGHGVWWHLSTIGWHPRMPFRHLSRIATRPWPGRSCRPPRSRCRPGGGGRRVCRWQPGRRPVSDSSWDRG